MSSCVLFRCVFTLCLRDKRLDFLEQTIHRNRTSRDHPRGHQYAGAQWIRIPRGLSGTLLKRKQPFYMVSSSISKEDQKRSYSYDFVQGYITKPLVNQNVVFIVRIFERSTELSGLFKMPFGVFEHGGHHLWRIPMLSMSLGMTSAII